MPSKSAASAGALVGLSSQLAGAVELASGYLVSIHARRRIPSSGIVWRDGVIVSASHTVKRDEGINVTLPGGDTAQATIVGRDAATDIIALRVDARVAAAPRADAGGLRVGSLALAVGRPGRSVTASFGVVSAVGEGWRTWEGTRIERVARLDLAVYDGFSGGALVDPAGALLGLNNSALMRGTAMALPVAAVDRVVSELLERGHVRRPVLGVSVHPVLLSPAVVTREGLDQDAGLLITSVAEKSPAERGGILVGDVLLSANNTAMRRPTDLLDALASTKTGASIALALLRGGAMVSLTITPTDRREMA